MTSGLIQFIMLIVVIVLSLTLSIVALIKARKEGFNRKWIAILILALGLLFITYLAYNRGEIEPAGWAQILLMLVLVCITGFYAWQAKKASDNAEASVKEMKEQRLSEAQPYLLLRLADDAIQWNETEPGKRPPTQFSVIVRNEGKGPATNVRAAMWHPERIYFVDTKGYLIPSEKWEATISRLNTGAVEMGIAKEGWLPELRKVVNPHSPGIIVAECKDIHQRTWVSYLHLEWHHSVDGYVMEGEQKIMELKENKPK